MQANLFFNSLYHSSFNTDNMYAVFVIYIYPLRIDITLYTPVSSVSHPTHFYHASCIGLFESSILLLVLIVDFCSLRRIYSSIHIFCSPVLLLPNYSLLEKRSLFFYSFLAVFSLSCLTLLHFHVRPLK